MPRALLALPAVLVLGLLPPGDAHAAFSFDGAWGRPGSAPGQFASPAGLATDAAGAVYVADPAGKRIQKFTAAGGFLAAWDGSGTPAGPLAGPAAVAAGPGGVYVADTPADRIVRFDADGRFVSTWGAPGARAGQFASPTGVAAGPDGALYVADAGNGRVQRFLPEGVYAGEWAVPGVAAGNRGALGELAVAPDGSVYVVDRAGSRVHAFTAAGAPLTAWGAPGALPGQLSGTATGIAAAAGGVYVADPGNRRVERFTAAGAFVERLDAATTGDPAFADATGVAAAPSGRLYVSHPTRARVAAYRQPAPGEPAGRNALPPPEAGVTANARPVRGRVRVRLPGDRRFVRLDRARQLPIGSLVDTRAGTVALITASGPAASQSGRFRAGVFRLLQSRSTRPVTELRLAPGSLPRACRRLARRTARGSRRPVRRLWSSARGRFRTRGRNASATVRGTRWLTEDRCDGTLVRVTTGSVTVRDHVRRRTVVVRAGDSYLARVRR